MATIAAITAASSANAAIVAPNGVVLVNRGNGFERVNGTVQLGNGDRVLVNEGSATAICQNGTPTDMSPGSVYTIGSTVCGTAVEQQAANGTQDSVNAADAANNGQDPVGGQGGNQGSSGSGSSGASGGANSVANGSGTAGTGGGTGGGGGGGAGGGGAGLTGVLVGAGVIGGTLGLVTYIQSQQSP